MSRHRLTITFVALLASVLLVAGVTGAQQRTLHFLAPGFSTEAIALLESEILPEFEALHNVDVTIEPIGWGERTDRIAILTAAGIPPDLIGTGYYSPYQEGADKMIAPLDRYLADWEHRNSIPEPVWETQRWRGQIVVMPLYFDLRGIGYNKRLFGESGLDPERPPQSWEELLEAIQLLTRFEPSGDSLAVRGAAFWGGAQEMLSWIHQTGIAPVDLEAFRSNLNTSEAIEAARFFAEMIRASRLDLPVVGGGFEGGALAMTTAAPGNARSWYVNVEGDFHSNFGVFAPRKSPSLDPVAVAFINGVAISEASPNKDLAWKFIELLMSDEVILALQPVTGWMGPRVDIIDQYDAPYLDVYYPLVPYIKAAILPPPRNDSQNGLDQIMSRVTSNEISPEQAMLEGHELWQRLLNEWRANLGE